VQIKIVVVVVVSYSETVNQCMPDQISKLNSGSYSLFLGNNGRSSVCAEGVTLVVHHTPVVVWSAERVNSGARVLVESISKS